MALADDIRVLRDRVLHDLRAAHDYYTDKRIAWKIVHKVVKAGNRFTNRNTITGTVTTEADLVGKARGYVAEQLVEATFQQFISIFESFLFDFLRLWLSAWPDSLRQKEVRFETVLDEPDKDGIIQFVVTRKVRDILQGAPADWFKQLKSIVNLGCPSADEVEWIAEAKASRDVLVHNRGIANKLYEGKAGKLRRYKEGERIDVPEPYHRHTWELIQKVVNDVTREAIARTP